MPNYAGFGASRYIYYSSSAKSGFQAESYSLLKKKKTLSGTRVSYTQVPLKVEFHKLEIHIVLEFWNIWFSGRELCTVFEKKNTQWNSSFIYSSSTKNRVLQTRDTYSTRVLENRVFRQRVMPYFLKKHSMELESIKLRFHWDFFFFFF